MKEKQKSIYSIRCTWCGAKIREGKEEETKNEDSSGVCLTCFYRMLGNYLRAQKHAVYGDFVSDR